MKENNEMNEFKFRIQTTIINEEDEINNADNKKSMQRHNSSSELYNHSVQKFPANSSQSINGNGNKISEDLSDQRTNHSAHSAERIKNKGGLIGPNVKQSVVKDRIISACESSGESSLLNSGDQGQSPTITVRRPTEKINPEKLLLINK